MQYFNFVEKKKQSRKKHNGQKNFQKTKKGMNDNET